MRLFPFWIFSFACLVQAEDISYIDASSPQAVRLHVKVADEKGLRLPCCLSLTDSKGNSFWGLDALGKPLTYQGEPRIWISGDTILSITPDTYRYAISRPFQHETVTGEVTVKAGKTQTLDQKLKWVVNLPQFGWFGGDAHQHVVHGEKEFAINLQTAVRIAQSEGGDWSSFNSAWSGVPGENPTLDELRAIAGKLSDDQFSVFIGDEYPKDHLGHMALLAGPVEDWNTQIGNNEYSYSEGEHEQLAHFEILRQVLDLGGLCLYTHPVREYGGTENSPANIARELPFDVLTAPALVPSVDWMTDDPDDRNAMAIWAFYLNWGYKIGVCAFTDTCYDRNDARPFNRRTYVYLGAKYPTAAAIIDAIKRGRTYGTTGPLMRLNVNGLPPGSAFPANYKPVVLSVDAFSPGADYLHRSNRPVLDRIEIVRNGVLYETVKLKDRNVVSHRYSVELRDKENSWYIVKVYATGERQVAISSPFYFRKIYSHPDVFPMPKPVRAHVMGAVTDAATGKNLEADIDLIEYALEDSQTTETISAKDGDFSFDCLATLRLRARANGYRPQTKSLFFDVPKIYRELILPLRRTDQLDPAYYEKLKTTLRNVKMDFTLKKNGD